MRKPTPVNLKVPRGAPEGFRIVYENAADSHPDYVAGECIMHRIPGVEGVYLIFVSQHPYKS